jgi:hypothetical protein
MPGLIAVTDPDHSDFVSHLLLYAAPNHLSDDSFRGECHKIHQKII